MAFSGGGAERGRAGESVSWIRSRGLDELGTCFFWFSTRNLGASRFICWLVVWNIWIVFPYIGNVIIPTNLHILRGVGIPPTSLYLHSLYKEALVMVGWCPSRPIPWPWHIWKLPKSWGVPPIIRGFKKNWGTPSSHPFFLGFSIGNPKIINFSRIFH